MALQLIESHRENAEIVTGAALCKKKTHEILAQFSFPKGLIPMTDVTEVGFNASIGFMWIRRKKKTNHVFRSISQKVSYDCEVTGFIEDGKMRNLVGVKGKELFISVTISDVCVTESGEIKFLTPLGVSRTHPAAAFQEE